MWSAVSISGVPIGITSTVDPRLFGQCARRHLEKGHRLLGRSAAALVSTRSSRSNTPVDRPLVSRNVVHIAATSVPSCPFP
jgi:hypothetical protein